MKKISRLMSMVLVFALMAVVAAVPANAAGYTNVDSVRGYKKFNSEWEKTRTYKVDSTVIAYMVYGYDTDWIKEDYVWTKSKECYSTAMVKRDGHDKDYCKGTKKGKNVYSKLEVTHKTYYVDYKINLSATYLEVTYTTASSSTK